MRAAIFRNGEIVVDQMPEPKPGPGRCWSSRWPAASAAPTCTRASTPIAWSNSQNTFPAASRWISPATSCSATNSAARCSTTVRARRASSSPARKVCSLPALLTAEGPQGIGYSNDNVGAYAERMLLSEALLLEVPNGLAAEHAALTEPLAVGVHAVAKANIRGGEVPLVIGCGPVGPRRHRRAEDQGDAPDRRRGLFAGAPGAGRKARRRHRGRSRAHRSPTRPGPSTPRCRRKKRPRGRRCRRCCRR